MRCFFFIGWFVGLFSFLVVRAEVLAPSSIVIVKPFCPQSSSFFQRRGFQTLQKRCLAFREKRNLRFSRKICSSPKKIQSSAFAFWMLEQLWLPFEKQLQTISKQQTKTLQAKRQKHFPVFRWYWDRKHWNGQARNLQDLQQWMRSIQPFLSEQHYSFFLEKVVRVLGDEKLSLPVETLLVSLLTRWLVKRANEAKTREIIRKMWYLMLTKKECPWWYTTFVATFSPQTLSLLAPHFEDSWCKARQLWKQQKYKTLSQTEQALDRWVQRFPRFVSKHLLGRTFNLRPIWGLRIQGSSLKRIRPSVFLVANQHGDEHLGTDLTLAFLEKHLPQLNQPKSLIRSWIKNRKIWILPILNPDGKEFDLRGGVVKWWRYNRFCRKDGTFGVDLNRNWNHQWKARSFYQKGRNLLPGSKPFSEKETQALQRLFRASRKVSAVLDIHQYGAFVLIPYAFTQKKLPPFFQKRFEKIGRFLTQNNQYRWFSASRLYPHQATLGDYGFGKYKALSLVLELGKIHYVGEKNKQKIIQENMLLLERFVELGRKPFPKKP